MAVQPGEDPYENVPPPSEDDGPQEPVVDPVELEEETHPSIPADEEE